MGVVAALAEHAFEHLFIEHLGWDRLRTTMLVTTHDTPLQFTPVAQKRGFTVFHCQTHRTVLANRSLLRDVQRQVRRTHHEHILVYSCETPRKQVWQWATSLADGRRILHREHPFFSSDPPSRLVERIEKMVVGIQEEDQTTLLDVLHRVRLALMPSSELNLFARRPFYATKSDRLAMAMKRGEPGAFQAFVEFHMPLARKSSRMLIRWFNMDSDDAEQTAMIGVIEAARRFDPDLGFQFSTYAGYRIRHVCQRHGLRWGMSVRVPDYFFWPCYKMAFVEARLVATFGVHGARSRFDRELKEAGITKEQWECFCIARRMCCFSDVDTTRKSLFGKPDESASIEQDTVNKEIREEVARNLELLPARQSRILKMRYGIGQREHTLEEVGADLSITRERVRQIQAKAEEKLQRLLLKSALLRDEFAERLTEPRHEVEEEMEA